MRLWQALRHLWQEPWDSRDCNCTAEPAPTGLNFRLWGWTWSLSFKVLSNPNHSIIQWFFFACDVRPLSHKKQRKKKIEGYVWQYCQGLTHSRKGWAVCLTLQQVVHLYQKRQVLFWLYNVVGKSKCSTCVQVEIIKFRRFFTGIRFWIICKLLFKGICFSCFLFLTCC